MSVELNRVDGLLELNDYRSFGVLDTTTRKVSLLAKFIFLFQLFLLSDLFKGLSGQKTEPFPAFMDLATLDSSDGLTILSRKRLIRLSSTRDYNADGYPDLLMGASHDSFNSKANAGAAYVLFGGHQLNMIGSVDLRKLNGTLGFAMPGTVKSEGLGRSISYAGDVNGDGIEDFMVSGKDDLGEEMGGVFVYLVYGHPQLGRTGTVNLKELNGTNGFTFFGNAQGGLIKHDKFYLALHICGPGDVNGDGNDDLLIGAWGRAHIFFGTGHDSTQNLIDWNQFNGSDGFVLEQKGIEAFGHTVIPGGDLNQDGFPDMVFNGFWDSSERGTTTILYGGNVRSEQRSKNLKMFQTTRILGANERDFSGSNLASNRDVNGDGVPDLVIVSPGEHQGKDISLGRLYVVFGHAGIETLDQVNLAELNRTNGLHILGDSSHKIRKATLGDLNHDGFADLCIGLRFSDPLNRGNAGAVSVLYGSQNISRFHGLTISQILVDNGFTIYGAVPGQGVGAAISADGDLNGDGVDDLVIASREEISYVVYGRNFSLDTVNSSSVQSTLLISGTTSSTAATQLDNSSTLFVSASTNINRTNPHTSLEERSPPLSLPLIGGIAAAITALACSILGGVVYFLKKKSDPHATENNTTLSTIKPHTEQPAGYMAISQIQKEMQSARVENQYDIIHSKHPESHYNDWPSKQDPHTTEHYHKGGLDQLNKDADVYLSN